MKRISWSLALLLLVGASLPVAQEAPAPAKVNVKALGSSARGAVESLAKDLGLVVSWPKGYSAGDLEYPVWVSTGDTEPAHAARLLSVAAGLLVHVDTEGGRLMLATPDQLPSLPARGYDVSVLASRHVAYVNQYGKPAKAGAAEGETPPECSAAEYLCGLADDVLWRASEPNLSLHAVGDRLLGVGPAARHAELQELLDVLAADEPGCNAAARREAELLAAMKVTPAPVLEDVTVASAIASLCAAVNAGFVLCRDVSSGLDDTHVAVDGKSDVAAALQGLLEQSKLQWDVVGNCVRVASEGETVSGWRVFDCADLLKKLDVGLQRQQTAPGKQEGHTRTLRDRDGIEYVADVLRALLIEQDCGAVVCTWGGRLLVRGRSAGLSRAETFLKELGWEPPKTSK